MARSHTYYDNLKVSRDAPDSVIRAAYRALAQQCHPDKNLNSAEAARVMKLINGAYAVLSDPAKRLEHDAWITLQEGIARPTASSSASEPPSAPATQQSSRRWPEQDLKPLKWVAAVFVVGLVLNYLYKPGQQSSRAVTTASTSRQQPVPAVKPTFDPAPAREVEPSKPAGPWGSGDQALADAGQPIASEAGTAKKWSEIANSPDFTALSDEEKDAVRSSYFARVVAPQVAPDQLEATRKDFEKRTGYGRRSASASKQGRLNIQPKGFVEFNGDLDSPGETKAELGPLTRSGYLPNARRAAGGGLSTFAVDNTNGDRGAEVRLYLGGRKPEVRGFYVKQGDKFTAKSLSPGAYVMRYRFIGSEATFEADKQFVLTEAETERGRRFSNVTVMLSRQRDGNLSTKVVRPEEF